MSQLLRIVIVLGLMLGAGLLVLGAAAHWYPALDIVNNGLPFLALGGVALFALSFAVRTRSLMTATAALLAVTLAVLLSGVPGAAPQAPVGAERFLRVVTFNLWGRNDHHLNKVAEFLAETKADTVVLQEVRGHHAAFIASLAAQYPYSVGDNGLVILSKHPIVADGRIDRAGEPFWRSLIIRWVRLDVNGTTIDLAGVHLARPFYPSLHEADVATLTAFVKQRDGPLIVAGDFNMAPWTVQLKTFTKTTGLGRFNTFYPTWPMRWRSVPLLPLVAIDNVFASRHFAKLAMKVGPRLDSDHRPVIADLALIE